MATTYRDNGRTLYSGTEAERLAYTIETSDTYEKNVFWIEPNGNEFRVIEGAWVKIKAAGAELVSQVSSTGVAQVINPDGSADVNIAGSGPETQTRGRWLQLDNAGAVEIAEWPTGANITYLTFFVSPVAGTAALAGDEYVAVVIDPIDAVAAAASLTQVESLQNDVNWLPIPVGREISVPLSAALVNGTLGGGSVAAKTVGGIALDLYIGGK